MARGRFLLYVGWLVFVLQTEARNPPITTNLWTRAGGGDWSDAAAWSAGKLPDSAQWIGLLAPGTNTIEINAQTAQQFPQSLYVSHLIVSNNNTVYLNNVGAAFHANSAGNAWTAVEVSRNAKLFNLNSDVFVRGGLGIDGGVFAQDGGAVNAPEALSIHGGGSYQLTNGVFNTGYLEMPDNGEFDQYGGTVAATNHLWGLQFSKYNLHDGEIADTGDELLIRDYSTFAQEGGVVHSRSVQVAAGYGESAYLMDGGQLYAGNVGVTAGMEMSVFEQNGGSVAITNTLTLLGSSRYYPPTPIEAKYTVGSNAVISARAILVDDSYGYCWFETAGRVSVAENITLAGSAQYPVTFRILDGTIACSNLVADGEAVLDISQPGGSLIVSNLFSISGYYPGVYNLYARPAVYELGNGSVTAGDIELTAQWTIASSTRAGRISNPGQLIFSGILEVGDANETLGQLVLTGDSTIDLGDGNAKIAFAPSSVEQWTSSAMLVVTNWNGLPNGGGNDQLKFGNDASGLSAGQLRQIHFINPNGFPGGDYLATILDTGEIVPAMTPQLAFTADGNNVVINWSSGGVLQSALSVEGPYTDIPSATSPYSFDVTVSPQLYLRLRP
jgi:hypothetical protein